MASLRRTSLWYVSASVLAHGVAAQSPAAPSHVAVSADSTHGVTAFINVSVIPMDRPRVLQGQTVLIEEGHILAMGTAKDVHIPVGALRVDGTGKFLLPGLADMHAHLSFYDSATAEQVLFMFLANGVTTIRNMDYLPYPPPEGSQGPVLLAKLGGSTILKFRARTARGSLLGPHIYTSSAWGGGHPADLRSMIADAMGNRQSEETQEQVDTLVAHYKAAGYDFIKVHDEDSVLYSYLVNAAHRVGIPFEGHVPDKVPLTQVFAAHQRSIEHLTGYDTLITTPSRIPELAAETKRAGVWNCPTMVLLEDNAGAISPATKLQWSEMRFASARARHTLDSLAPEWQPRSQTSRKLKLLAAEQQLVKALQDSGAGLLLGTDAPAGPTLPGFVIHRELAALVQAGLTPYQALAAGTKNVAAYFGTESESGTIAVGKRADLVLLNGNPLTDIQQTSQIAGVMISGRWLSRVEIDQHLARDVGLLDNRFDDLQEILTQSMQNSGMQLQSIQTGGNVP